jgi:hypothetical protein
MVFIFSVVSVCLSRYHYLPSLSLSLSNCCPETKLGVNIASCTLMSWRSMHGEEACSTRNMLNVLCRAPSTWYARMPNSPNNSSTLHTCCSQGADSHFPLQEAALAEKETTFAMRLETAQRDRAALGAAQVRPRWALYSCMNEVWGQNNHLHSAPSR